MFSYVPIPFKARPLYHFSKFSYHSWLTSLCVELKYFVNPLWPIASEGIFLCTIERPSNTSESSETANCTATSVTPLFLQSALNLRFLSWVHFGMDIPHPHFLPFTFGNFNLRSNVEADSNGNKTPKVNGMKWHIILGRHKYSIQSIGKLHLKIP